MINKYWTNRKKVEWLNKNFESKSNGSWGRFWYTSLDGPPYFEQVAYLPQETQGPDGLEVDYEKIKEVI